MLQIALVADEARAELGIEEALVGDQVGDVRLLADEAGHIDGKRVVRYAADDHRVVIHRGNSWASFAVSRWCCRRQIYHGIAGGWCRGYNRRPLAAAGGRAGGTRSASVIPWCSQRSRSAGHHV